MREEPCAAMDIWRGHARAAWRIGAAPARGRRGLKCISVCQPFADLIVSGAKSVELRSWNTRHRGSLLVHAALKVRDADCRRLGVDDPVTGAIVGRVRLVGVKKYAGAAEVSADDDLHLAGSGFGGSRYGFLLKDPVRLRTPIPWRGYPWIFEADVAGSVDADRPVSEIMDEDRGFGRAGGH